MKLFLKLFIFVFILSACTTDANESLGENTMHELDDSNVVQEEKQVTTTGESTAFSPYKSTVSLTLDGDDIIDAEFEEFLEDGTNKNEASKAGEYTSPNYQLGEFYEQIDSLETYVIENDKFPELTEGKDVDGSSGASVNLSGFEDAYNQALEKVNKNL